MGNLEKNKPFGQVVSAPFFKWSILAMLVSYFYNLSVFGYSIKGENEFRIYDFVGIYWLFIFFKHKGIIKAYINNIPFFNKLYVFLVWCGFTMFFTLIFSVFEFRILWFVQSILYLFHFWIFFLTAVFLSIYIQDLKKLKQVVQFLLIIASLAFLVVILQNLNLIPFLWNDSYYRAYHGFLSGTLGPNKIVVGISSLMVFILGVGLINEKRVKINFMLINVTMIIALITLLMSGSRTSYVGLIIFALFYLVRNPFKFFVATFLIGIMFFAVGSIKPEIFEKIGNTFENRIEKKIRKPSTLKEGRVDELYEDLGAGRKDLSIQYIEYLVTNPYIIPCGIGFNNRLMINFPAHNIYLSLINEVGLIGLYLYVSWLFSFLKIQMRHFKQLEMALKGLVLSLMITLFFGEHLYIYRPVFGLLGLFMAITVVLLSPYFYFIGNSEKLSNLFSITNLETNEQYQ